MDYGALLQRILERLVPSLEGQGIPDEVDAAFDELGRASERLDGPAAAQGLRRLAACAKPNQSLAARNLAQRIGMDPVAWAAVQPARKERLMAEVVDVAVILRNEIFDELRPERYVPDATTSRVTERRTGSVPLAARRLAPAARLRAVGAAYRDSQVLTDVNLDLFAGEVVALVGANGSGKSTLLRLIAGIEPASTGDVTYPLLAVRGRSRNAILDQIQLVEQTPSPFPGTVEGALRAYGALRGVVRDGKFDHVASVMRTMELWQYRTNTYGELSSGYRMRFELSKAMVKLPTILLLDEPLGPLDSVTRRSFLRQVRDLTQARRPLCVVLTAVDESQTGHIANRTIILNQNTGPAGGPDLVVLTRDVG